MPLVRAVQFALFFVFEVTQYSKSNSTANEKVKKIYKGRVLGRQCKEKLEFSASEHKAKIKSNEEKGRMC